MVVVGVVVALRWRFTVGVAIVAAASLAAATEPWRWGVGIFDVFFVEAAAAARLLHGGNPYSATIYDRVPVSPGVLAVGPEHLPFGPLVAIAGLPGALVGDIRVASLLWALGAAGVVILVARQAKLSPLSKRMLLLLTVASPLVPTMVVTAWPETLMLAMFGLSIALHRHHPVWMVMAIAASLLVVPTALVLFFPFFVWSPSWRLRILAGSLVALGVMFLFTIGVGLPALWFDTVVRHVWEPTHYDGLTVGATVFVAGLGAMPSWIFPAVVVAACAVILRRRPRDTADLCVAAAFLFLVSTAFASYARFNFYYVVAWLLLLALASIGIDPGRVSLSLLRAKAVRKPEPETCRSDPYGALVQSGSRPRNPTSRSTAGRSAATAISGLNTDGCAVRTWSLSAGHADAINASATPGPGGKGWPVARARSQPWTKISPVAT